tara:strand:+ start:266 stop:700 length:435 start_codon:yes stop_codon:yes gene_type:complete
MIKKLINKIFSQKISEKDIECAIDENTVDCDKLEAPLRECGPGHFTQGYGFFGYTGVPAPVLTPVDDWFSSPYGCPTEKQKDYMEKEAEIKKQEAENRQYWTKESANIHQEMYDLATKSGKTTTQLDPIGGSENFQGGSENVHR